VKKSVKSGSKGGVPGAGVGLGVGVPVGSGIGVGSIASSEVVAFVVADVVDEDGFDFSSHATSDTMSIINAIKTAKVFRPAMVAADTIERILRIPESVFIFIS